MISDLTAWKPMNWTVTSVNQQHYTAVKQVFCSFEKILYLWVCTVICILYNEFAPSLAPHSASLRKWVTSCADGLFTRRHICSRPHLGFARYCQIVGTAHYQLQKVQNFQQWSKLSNPNWVVIILLAAQCCSEVPGNTRGRRPLTFLSCFSPLLHR